jgi:hypothetical protein
LRYAFRCGNYEGEDVLCEVDDVDLLPLKAGTLAHIRRELHKRLVWHDFTGKAVSLNLAFQPNTLERDYDLFMAYLPLTQDLIHIPSIRGWKARCKTSICWIDELWAADIPSLKPWLSALDAFDHIVTGYLGTVDALSHALKRPCHYLPIGVDALRLTPLVDRPRRVIDILSIGRRHAGLHEELLKFATRAGLFYVHDTFTGSYTEVEDHRVHRAMFANMAKRSRYFVVARAKATAPEETRGQIEIGLRYYEASAAGAVMIGEAPDCPSFRRLFDWPEVVVELSEDGADVVDVLSQLESHPEVVARISRRNAAEALLRHDWVYRWERILQIAGLEPSAKLMERKRRLSQLAHTGLAPDSQPTAAL